MPAGNHSAVMGEINAMGHIEENTATAKAVNEPVRATATPSKGKERTGLFGLGTGADGTLQEEWDPYLPRPPSMREIQQDVDPNAEQVAVFNANTQEGSTMVRVLSEKGVKVVAAVRVFTSKNTKALIKLKGVTVKVADTSDKKSLLKVAEGCAKAFLVTKFWEKFESRMEEQMAANILTACADMGMKHLVLATFEDIGALILRGKKSQLVPTKDGRIFPRFDGMAGIDALGKERGIQITHMMTSYFDEPEQKRSIILIRGENGRIIVQPFIQDGGEQTIM
jgi:NmrA-like family